MSNVLESTLHEAVHNRELDVLASAPEAETRAYLWELWDTVADFDVLLQAGDAMGRAGVQDAAAWFREWLWQQSPVETIVLDISGAFLLGYWAHMKHVDEAVVERLLTGLELPGLGRDARDSLVCALATAYGKLPDRDLAKRITARFEAILSHGEQRGFQPVVELSLRSVLANKERIDE